MEVIRLKEPGIWEKYDLNMPSVKLQPNEVFIKVNKMGLPYIFTCI